MQKLTCTVCNKTWEREPKRGRPPKVCPACKDAPVNSVSDVSEAPGTSPSPKKNKRRKKSKWERLAESKPARPDLDTLPFTQRTSGWCTDYDPAPEAQHEKCDGDLGKYRCPCECHGWDDL